VQSTVNTDTSELRKLFETQSKLGRAIEGQCASLETCFQTLEQHMGKETRDITQVIHFHGGPDQAIQHT
jgi:hypothetical protein